MWGFQIRFKDIIDILLVAILLYQTYKLLKASGAANVFVGLFAFIIAWFLVSRVFEMELLGIIFDKVISVGAIALVVLFQDEIRTLFSRIGSRSNWRSLNQLSKHFKRKETQQETDQSTTQIVLACKNMSKTKTGALIVCTRTQDLRKYALSGERINGFITARLLENIFFKNSPLHDGALIIANGKIHSAACILPISKNHSIPKHLGLRHRAALGITEKTDAIAIVVSEETGKISYALGDTIRNDIKPEELERILSQKQNRTSSV